MESAYYNQIKIWYIKIHKKNKPLIPKNLLNLIFKLYKLIIFDYYFIKNFNFIISIIIFSFIIF